MNNWQGYEPTRKEAEKIKEAFNLLNDKVSQWNGLIYTTKDEARGERIPLIAAKGLVCKWALEGAERPDIPLRQIYSLRTRAVYSIGLGADLMERGKLSQDDIAKLAEAREAHDAAFRRMHERDLILLRHAMQKASEAVNA